MKVDIITLFPEMFKGPFDESIIKRAKEKGLVEIKIHDLRKWAVDKRGTVDDRPYGGGTGMVLIVKPIVKALDELKKSCPVSHVSCHEKIVILTPQGKVFNQRTAQKLSRLKHLILLCGHYEGFDERIRRFVDEEISIGDYILTGGEIPAMVLVDTIARLIPGVLEKPEAIEFESFSNSKIPHTQLLEYPQYTRPENFRGLKVPKILLSGNHQKIAKWRANQALKRTKQRRPDLLKSGAK